MKYTCIITAVLFSLVFGGCSQRAAAPVPAPTVSVSPPTGGWVTENPVSVDNEHLSQLETADIQALQADPQYHVEGAFIFSLEEYESLRALDADAPATFYVTSTRCTARGANLDAQIELAAEFLCRGCDVSIYTGDGESNDSDYGDEVCFITTAPSWLWKLSAYMQSNEGTLYRISPQIEKLQQHYGTRVWPMSAEEASAAISRVVISEAERELRQQNSREFHESSDAITAIGCFYLKKNDYESFLSLPQGEDCVFSVHLFSAQKYEDDREANIVAAQIFAEAGCRGEVYYGKGTVNEFSYEGYVCFVTAPPERMWALGVALEDYVGSDYFYIEPQYESVKNRMNTLVWPTA